jgi:uncharacterized protein
MQRSLTFELLPAIFAIVRLEPAAPQPSWAAGGDFVSITRTRRELSIVCEQERLPARLEASRDWRALELRGRFAFDETGIAAAFTLPLAEAEIGVFVVSTFDTDYLLIRSPDLDRAAAVLRGAGLTIVEPRDETIG